MTKNPMGVMFIAPGSEQRLDLRLHTTGDIRRAEIAVVAQHLLHAAQCSGKPASWLHSATATEVTSVHYKGSGPQMLDLAAVRVDVASGNSLGQIPLIKAGKIRPPVILTPRRSKLLPGVPTAVEQVPEFSYSNWLGFVAPATIVNKLGDAFAKTAKAPALIARLEAKDIALVGSSPTEFRQHIIKEIANWKRIVNENDGKMEE